MKHRSLDRSIARSIDPTPTSLLTLVGCFLLAALAGCSPPPEPTAGTELSVNMPDDPEGDLEDTPIDPPDLTAINQDGSESDVVGEAPATEEVASAETEEEEVDENGDPFPDAHAAAGDWERWPAPTVCLFVTGQQNGYIEPCGCTGLDRQKGGIARRFTLMEKLRGKGWQLVPMDAGNQVRRFGRQAEIKLQTSAKAMDMMDYEVVGFGPDDVRLGVGELLSVAADDGSGDSAFASRNVVLIDESLMPTMKMVVANGLKIAVTSILDPAALDFELSDDITVDHLEKSAMRASVDMRNASPDFTVLMFYGKEEDGKALMQSVPGFDLIVVAGGYGEPTFQPEKIEGSKTRMIVTGNKGMYVGLVGLYNDSPLRYARVPLTHDFEDAPEMRLVMKEYQDQLRDVGLEGLGLLPPIPHSSGQKFVGTKKCGECHTSAYEIWEGTPHALATDHIVEPPKERGDVARHFDPECLSCHVTGWNPQEFYPYLSGYLSLQDHKHLTGNGCENCHGPGSDHVAAEVEGSTISETLRDQYRDAMKLPLEKAKEKCMTCHDLDNSPDFHEEDAFEDIYWPEVEHYGLD